MTDDRIVDTLFQHPEPQPPGFDPPDLQRLRELLRRRRTQRRVFAGVGGLIATCLTAALIAVYHDAFLGISQADPATSVGNMSVATTTSPSADTPDHELDSRSPARVFAKIRQPVAIFEMDPENKYLRHVGWVESQEMVPVDMSRFTHQQQETVEAVLRNNDTPVSYISL